MTRRTPQRFLVSAAILTLGSFLAVRGSGGDCSSNPSVQKGKMLFYGQLAKDKNDPLVCANCHGDPALPCDPNNPPGVKFKEKYVCNPCPYPKAPMRGLNKALVAEDKKMLKDFVQQLMPTMYAQNFTVKIEGIQDYKAMFDNLGINTEQAFNDVAAYLACADPIRYDFHGVIVDGAKFNHPVPLEKAFVISSEYNPPANLQPGVTITVFPLDSPNDNLGYVVKGLLGGQYSVSILPDPFLFTPLTDSPAPLGPNPPPPSGSLLLSWDRIPGCTFAGNSAPDPVNFEATEINPDTVEGADGYIVVSCETLHWVICETLYKVFNQGIRELPKPGPPPEKIKPFHQFQLLTRQFMQQGLIPTQVGSRFIANAQAIIDQINRRAPIRSLR